MADVSAVADPETGAAIYSSYGSTSGNWWVFGGTSASAPIVAGVYAASAGKATTPLRDIVSGSTGWCSPLYLCNALTGYDSPTGHGVPNGPTGRDDLRHQVGQRRLPQRLHVAHRSRPHGQVGRRGDGPKEMPA